MKPAEVTKAIYEATNHQRKLNNLPLFRYAGCLERSALLHSGNMVKYNFFSHSDYINLSFGNPLMRIQFCNGDFQIVGENLAFYPIILDRFPEKVVNGWMNSQGHRENILKPEFNFIGIGSIFITSGNNIPYSMITQNFGGYLNIHRALM